MAGSSAAKEAQTGGDRSTLAFPNKKSSLLDKKP
jgi:hypothetical protein